MKKVLHILLLSILILVSCILIYMGLAFGLSRIEVPKENVSAKDVAVYIITNGVHADIVVPLKNYSKDWTARLKLEHTLNKDARFNLVALGWGNKEFYLQTPTWADLKISTAIKAVFGLGSTAIHATLFKSLKEDSTCVKIDLSTGQYLRLVNFIEKSFKKDSNSDFMPIKPTVSYGNNDFFYDAVGVYSLFYTCNTWTNDALKSCGQKAGFWTPFDSGIFYHYNK